jgi:hypothetical protein
MEEVSRYVTPTTVAMERPQLTRARWRHTTVEEVLQAVFSVGPLRDYMTWPTEVSSTSECNAVEGSPAGNGSWRISFAKIRYQETSSENIAEE